MSNNKQSSVEWLINKCACADLRPELWNIIKEQAKAMHKEEIIDAANKLLYHSTGPGDTAAEQYYNETFGGNDEQSMIDYNAMEEESEMDNYKEMEDEHKPETATEWLREEITYDNGTGQRRGSFDEFVDLTHYFDQAKEMELVAKEASYALGYSEGYKRSLEMVEWYIKHHIKGIE